MSRLVKVECLNEIDHCTKLEEIKKTSEIIRYYDSITDPKTMVSYKIYEVEDYPVGKYNPDSNLIQLESMINQWAIDRDIYSHSDSKSQLLKTMEELGELAKAINHKYKEDIMDGIGDVVVTLIILCGLEGTTLQECLQYAYNEIKNRKGKMINGVFLKEIE